MFSQVVALALSLQKFLGVLSQSSTGWEEDMAVWKGVGGSSGGSGGTGG